MDLTERLTMAKKQQGGATIEREAGPIESLAEAIERAAGLTPEAVGELKTQYPFNGVWPGQSLNVKLKLTPESSDTMRRLYLALNVSNTRLANGRHVGSIVDVVTWLMEDATRQIDERAGA